MSLILEERKSKKKVIEDKMIQWLSSLQLDFPRNVKYCLKHGFKFGETVCMQKTLTKPHTVDMYTIFNIRSGFPCCKVIQKLGAKIHFAFKVLLKKQFLSALLFNIIGF